MAGAYKVASQVGGAVGVDYTQSREGALKMAEVARWKGGTAQVFWCPDARTDAATGAVVPGELEEPIDP